MVYAKEQDIPPEIERGQLDLNRGPVPIRFFFSPLRRAGSSGTLLLG